MNEIIILVILMVSSISLIIYSLLSNKNRDEDHVKRRMSGKHAPTVGRPSITGRQKNSTARQVLEKITPYAMKPVMPTAKEMSTLRGKLAQAGFRRESASRFFLASKTILGIGAAFAAILIAWGSGYEPKQLFGIMTMAGGIGFMLPNSWLGIAMRKRMEKIRNGLPDSLDLLVVSVEAGLALDAGLVRVSEEMDNVHPELCEELQIATLETQMGLPRQEALDNLAQRCGVKEVRSLVAVIGQAEKFGTSVAKALRTQADSLRIKRRLRAEERAQQTTVKLMIPLILFIFPSIFVVLVGPAAMKIAESFGKGGIGG